MGFGQDVHATQGLDIFCAQRLAASPQQFRSEIFPFRIKPAPVHRGGPRSAGHDAHDIVRPEKLYVAASGEFRNFSVGLQPPRSTAKCLDKARHR